MRVFAPSTRRTKRGIGIGDTAEMVMKAYSDALAPNQESEPSEETIVAGSLYGGLAFTLEDGIVTEMFLGAMSE